MLALVKFGFFTRELVWDETFFFTLSKKSNNKKKSPLGSLAQVVKGPMVYGRFQVQVPMCIQKKKITYQKKVHL